MAKNTSNEVTRRYNRKTYSQLMVSVLKEDREILDAYAVSQGMATSEFIKRLLMREVPGFKGYKEG